MNKATVLLFIFSVFLINFLPVKDTDFGWHYRCGKESCIKNNFSYFLPDYKAAYPSFIYDKSLAFVFDRFGFVGTSLTGALVITVAALIFAQLTNWYFFYLLLFLSWPVFNLGLRSQIITYLFFLLTLFILKKTKENRNWLFIFPLLFFIWVNTHIGFFIGLFIFLFFLIDRFIPLSHDRNRVVMIFLSSVIVTLLNPFGINVYYEIINHFTSPLVAMIAEWTEPFVWQKILIISLTAIYFFITIKKKNWSLFNTLLIVFFAVLAFKGIRNLPFFYTVYFYAITPFIKEKLTRLSMIFWPALVSLTIFAGIINIPKTIDFDTSWNIYCNKGLSVYPCQAIKNYSPLTGNVYAAYEWGGFLIWQKPQIKVFADGRMPAWKDEQGKSPYQAYLEIIQTQTGWNEELNKLKTNYLLINNGSFLDLLLQKEADKYHWQETYRDNIAVIYRNLYN